MLLPHPYEALEELAPGLYTARRTAGKDVVVVRVATAAPAAEDFPLQQLHSPDIVSGRGQAQSRIQSSPYWVPILDSGESADTVWCVYPHYPDSLARYLAFTSLSETAVWHVMDRLVRALQDFRTQAGRPHGNIKPENVLLETTRGEWWQTVRLSDPLSDTECNAKTDWDEDLRAIGDICFRMVLQRAPEPMEVPSNDSPWTEAIGPNGSQWRELCANLLDPAREVTLDELQAQLEKLRPRTSPRRRILRVAALLIPILILPVGIFWWPANPARIPPAFRDQIIRLRCAFGLECYDPTVWTELCEEYDSWLGTFAAEATADERLQRWRQDQYLDRLLGLLEQASLETLDPRGIAQAQIAYRDLIADHPEDAKTCDAYDLTLASRDNVLAVKRVLQQAPEEQGGWAAMRYLSGRLAGRCEEADWQATAAHLRALPDDIVPEHDTADAIEQVLRWWNDVGQLAYDLDQRIAAVDEHGTKALSRLNAAVTAELRKGSTRSRGTPQDIDEIRGYIEEAGKVTSRIETFLNEEWSTWPEQERADWANEEVAVLKDAEMTGLDVYRRWLSEARQFSTDDSADWLMAVIKEDEITTSSVLDEAWRQRRDALIAEVSRGELRRNPQRNAALRSQVESLRYLISALDDQSILPASPRGGIGDAIWAKRENALARILALHSGQPVEELKQSTEVRELCAEYRDWRRELPALAEQLTVAARNVRLLLGYDERPQDGGPTIREVRERWVERDLWQASGLPPALENARRWMDQLAVISTETATARLSSMAADTADALPVRLAAWRRLGQFDWPLSDAERTADAQIRDQLLQDLQVWDAELDQRREALRWELQIEGRRRDAHRLLTALRNQENPVLKEFAAAYEEALRNAAANPGSTDAIDALELLAGAADDITQVVLADDWPEQYHQQMLAQELSVPDSGRIAFFRSWPAKVSDYRLLSPDPRGDPQQWRDRMQKLEADLATLEPFPEETRAAAESLQLLKEKTQTLLATAPIKRHEAALQQQVRELQDAARGHREDFGLLEPNPILPKNQWDTLLARLLSDIVELADGREDLRRTHATLREHVDRLLKTAPVRRHRQTIETLLGTINETIDLLESEVDPSLWLDKVRAVQTITDDPMANAVWLEKRRGLIGDMTAEYLKTNRATYRLLRDQVRSLNAVFAETDWKEELPAGLPPPPNDLPSLTWHDELPPEIQRLREETIQKATVDETSSADGRQKLFVHYREVRAALERCRKELTQADMRLSQWALPVDTLTQTGGPRLQEVLLDWQRHPHVTETRQRCPALDAFCTGLFKVNRQLMDIAEASSPSALAERMAALLEHQKESAAPTTENGTGGSAPAATDQLELYACYERLDDIGWPQTLDQMRADVRYSTWLLARLPRARSTSLREQLEQEQLQRWAHGFERLSACRDIFQGGIPLFRTAFNKTASDAKNRFDNLALHAQVNLVIAALIESLGDGLSTEEALVSRDAAVADLERLAQQVKHPDPRFVYINERIEKLKTVETGAATAGGILGLAQSGPGRHGWQASINSERNVVSYSKTINGTTYVLTFVKVTPPTDGEPRPGFLCTTELPVGLFVDLCSSAGQTDGLWEEMLTFYTEDVRNALADPRLGPRTWHLNNDGNRVTFEAAPRLWLTEIDGFTSAVHYPDGMRPDPPEREHPLQYIPPRAAVFFCLRLGCRLPTAGEWRAALEQAPADARTPNLRDPKWYRQHQHIALYKPGSGGLGGWRRAAKHWPHADAFPFSEAITGERVRPEDESDFHMQEDGYLWFRAVPSGATTPVTYVADLAGNVAEYTYEDPDELDLMLNKNLLSLDEVQAKTAKPRKFAVIGDSALSSPLATEERGQAHALPGTDCWVKGFSDVGIRLAFTAPDEDIPQKLLALAESLCMPPGE